MTKHPNHCYDLHHTLAIDFVNKKVDIGACCQSGRVSITDNLNIDDLFLNPKLKILRADNLHGNLSENFCNACTKIEKVGGSSRRIQTSEFYQNWDDTNGIRSLDIKLGNLCNLKCTICGPESSSSWISDATELGMAVADNFFYAKNYHRNVKLQIDDISILKDLEMIKFWGGEPLLEEKHADILEFLQQIGVLKNCRVIYNTNGTRRVSDRILKLWSQAKLVELYFSIDDIENRFEYQRFGANWYAILDNLDWYRREMPDNHLFYIMCTVSYLNIWYLPELTDWKKQFFNQSRLGDEVRLITQPVIGVCAVDVISEKFANGLNQKFLNYLQCQEFMKFPKIVKDFNPTAFINYVNNLDRIRSTSWKKTFKDVASLIL